MSPRILRGILWILAIYAMLLSLETWIRTPGSIRGWPLPPERILLEEIPYERDPGVTQQTAVKEVPTSAQLVRRWVVSYRSQPAAHAPGAPGVIHLAEIEATGSGRANRLPARRLREWMGGLGPHSSCLFPGPPGQLQHVDLSRSAPLVAAPRAAREPWTTMLWLLGLGRSETVRCLWVGSDRPLTDATLRALGRLIR